MEEAIFYEKTIAATVFGHLHSIIYLWPIQKKRTRFYVEKKKPFNFLNFEPKYCYCSNRLPFTRT